MLLAPPSTSAETWALTVSPSLLVVVPSSSRTSASRTTSGTFIPSAASLTRRRARLSACGDTLCVRRTLLSPVSDDHNFQQISLSNDVKYRLQDPNLGTEWIQPHVDEVLDGWRRQFFSGSAPEQAHRVSSQYVEVRSFVDPTSTPSDSLFAGHLPPRTSLDPFSWPPRSTWRCFDGSSEDRQRLPQCRSRGLPDRSDAVWRTRVLVDLLGAFSFSSSYSRC